MAENAFPHHSSGRSWIFIRGLVRGRGHWGDFGEKFAARFPQDSFELLDLPGNGERGKEKSPWQLVDYVRAIRESSQAIRAGRKVHLLALSLGGMIAVEWMQKFPQDLEKSYLVCTSTSGLKFYERFRPLNYLKILPLTLPHSAQAHENIMMSLISNSPERQRQIMPELVRYSAAYPVNGANFLRQMYAASRSQFPPQAPGPVQLIGSYGDHLVAPSCTLKIAERWHLVPAMHPWAGHDIAIDDPYWLLEQML